MTAKRSKRNEIKNTNRNKRSKSRKGYHQQHASDIDSASQCDQNNGFQPSIQIDSTECKSFDNSSKISTREPSREETVTTNNTNPDLQHDPSILKLDKSRSSSAYEISSHRVLRVETSGMVFHTGHRRNPIQHSSIHQFLDNLTQYSTEEDLKHVYYVVRNNIDINSLTECEVCIILEYVVDVQAAHHSCPPVLFQILNLTMYIARHIPELSPVAVDLVWSVTHSVKDHPNSQIRRRVLIMLPMVYAHASKTYHKPSKLVHSPPEQKEKMDEVSSSQRKQIEFGDLTSAICHIVSNRLLDQDPRVRAEALVALRLLFEKDFPPMLQLWPSIQHLLADHQGIVRLRCVECLQNYFESYIKVTTSCDPASCASDVKYIAGRSEEDTFQLHQQTDAADMANNIIDDAFVSICSLATDISVPVRIAAFQAMASLKGVSETLLLQTFDKKLMSHLRLRKSAHDTLKEKHGIVKQTTYNNSVAPQGDLAIQDVSIMSAGACGAFIHGLEDEIHEVRLATLNAIRALAINFHPLASKALDFLVDMFNDEIERVRIAALLVMTDISPYYVLQEEQLDMMLGIFDDGNMHVRHAAHRLFTIAHVINHHCLMELTNTLLFALGKYPQDALSVYKCTLGLGCHHTAFTELVMPHLLKSNSTDVCITTIKEDPGYITILCLAVGAITASPYLTNLFPNYIMEKWKQLVSVMPQLYEAFLLLIEQNKDASPRLGALKSFSRIEAIETCHCLLSKVYRYLAQDDICNAVERLDVIRLRLQYMCNDQTFQHTSSRMHIIFHFVNVVDACLKTSQVLS